MDNFKYFAIDYGLRGHSLLYWCIYMRLGRIDLGVIYLTKKIIKYGVFQNKAKCLYLNTLYQ